MNPYDINPEPAHRRYGRRLLTVTGLFLFLAAYLALLPLTLLATVVGDLRRRRGWILLRALVFVGFYLACYAAVLLGLFLQWALSGAWTGSPAARDRLARWTVWIAVRFTRALYFGNARIYRTHTQVEGDEIFDRGGPFILFMRHVSVGDPIVPFAFVTGPHGIVFRHIVKHELLFDPAFDIGLHRIRTLFIRRQSGEAGKEIALLKRGMQGLGPREGVVMWPEGTRFTPAKRERVLEKLRRRDPEFHRMASALKNTLPPHRGGPGGVLEANEAERADVVFCAHVGLEGTQHIRSFTSGALLGRTIRIRFWRVPYGDIPKTREERIRWLYHWWGVMDRWIGGGQISNCYSDAEAPPAAPGRAGDGSSPGPSHALPGSNSRSDPTGK